MFALDKLLSSLDRKELILLVWRTLSGSLEEAVSTVAELETRLRSVARDCICVRWKKMVSWRLNSLPRA
ncbi:unnamed protein product [Soboliphyme baturini]|uniref:Transposase n=1 Tax=Soboliphyme baturini TaxID=241478 RepID=A0A183IIA6_9BILA|nr:unnamed protein product [Soboliphyme baturini]